MSSPNDASPPTGTVPAEATTSEIAAALTVESIHVSEAPKEQEMASGNYDNHEVPPPMIESTGSLEEADDSADAEEGFDGPTEAHMFQTIDTLGSIYGIPAEFAKQAIQAVGTDVTKCYNYVLANGSSVGLDIDTAKVSAPIETCPHVKYHVRLSADELPTPQMNTCGDADEDTPREPETDDSEARQRTAGEAADEDGMCPSRGNNWLCLHCGAIRCSQFQHGVAHYKDSLQTDPGEDEAGHCIAVSLSSLSVWCDACEEYIKDPAVDVLTKKLQELEFGDEQAELEEESVDDNKCRSDDDDSDEDSDEDSGDEEDPDDERRHVGRSASMLFGDEGLEDVVYPFGDAPRSLADVAKFIQSDDCQSIIILAGAGMSVASGIPDFRSAGGLYDTLRPNLLTASEVEREAIRVDPTTALEMGMFLQNPLPCLELNRPFILGTRDRLWKATLAHRFVELLHMKTGKLTRLYQQNIDGLEAQCTNLPREKVVMVHGSMDEAECASCNTKSNFHSFCSLVQKNIKDLEGKDPTAPATSSPIACDLCGYETMKPSIVLFRSSLPQEFFHNTREDLPDVDLLIVVGTSLAVAPANSLVYRSPRSAMRVVVNREPVGYRLGIDYSDHAKRDFFAQGDIDNVLLDLANELGWLEDLQTLCDHLPDSSARVLNERLGREESTSAAKRQKVGVHEI